MPLKHLQTDRKRTKVANAEGKVETTPVKHHGD